MHIHNQTNTPEKGNPNLLQNRCDGGDLVLRKNGNLIQHSASDIVSSSEYGDYL